MQICEMTSCCMRERGVNETLECCWRERRVNETVECWRERRVNEAVQCCWRERRVNETVECWRATACSWLRQFTPRLLWPLLAGLLGREGDVSQAS